MAAGTIAINELEWRSHAVMADAGRVISGLASDAKIAHKHYSLLNKLNSLNGNLSDLLRTFHSQQSISTLESVDSDQLEKICKMLSEIVSKTKEIDREIRTLEVKYWKPFYEARRKKLVLYNEELISHINAFEQSESALIVLSKKDQDFFLQSLLDSPEPNLALRRAFARK